MNEITATIERLRAGERSGAMRSAEARRAQLLALRRLLTLEEDRLLDALAADMKKPRFEAWSSEVGFLRGEVEHALAHLDRWMKPRSRRVPLVLQPGRAHVVYEPLGVVLVIAPWNYPLHLLLGPLVGALAAGNTALLKPSELAPSASRAVAELVPRYLDPNVVAVVEGGVETTTALLAERFDAICFTGSGRVGRVVLEAAAKHLTPVLLELGGKCPCIVDREVDLDVAVRRVVWGKFWNAGQTCVAPDHVLVHRSLYEPFVAKARAALRDFYGVDPQASPDYARIVNERHFDRLRALLDGAETIVGGEHDRGSLYLAPTLVRAPEPGSGLDEEEIFGPVLPIVPVDDLDAALARRHAAPLVTYVFTKDERVVERVRSRSRSAAVVVNDVLAHLTVPDLPFGGVGESGSGNYHGRYGFRAFSHARSILERATRPDPSIRYPPYGETKLRILKHLV